MFRLRLIRRKTRPKILPLAAGDAAFAVLLVIAVGVGGPTAWSGLPRVMGVLFPPGFMAAQASIPMPVTEAHLRIDLGGAGVTFATRTGSRLPAITIVIDDLGEDLAGTDRAMLLPAPVTLSFLPFAEDSRWLAPAAIKRGHQVLVHVPMESLSGKDAGPMMLTVNLPVTEIRRRLAWDLKQVPGAIGINNHEGSRFTSDAAALAPVADMLAARGLFFFDSRTGPRSQVVPVARRYGVMSAARDIFLDDSLVEKDIAVQLAALEARAKSEGVAIAIGHPHDVTLTLLAKWLAAKRGYELIPLSEAMQRKSVRETAVALR